MIIRPLMWKEPRTLEPDLGDHKKFDYAVVDTDNFGGDYPDEKWVFCHCTLHEAEDFADALNDTEDMYSPRYFKVVDLPYTLKPGFEP